MGWWKDLLHKVGNRQLEGLGVSPRARGGWDETMPDGTPALALPRGLPTYGTPAHNVAPLSLPARMQANSDPATMGQQSPPLGASPQACEKFAALVWVDMTVQTCAALPELITPTWPEVVIVWN